MPSGPIEGSYWVEPGLLLAGPYPDDQEVDALVEAGIAATVDLTETDERWTDYWSARPELEHRRVGFRDFAPPSDQAMRDALGSVGELLAQGTPVYVHCRGGKGRTGCFVACFLIEQGARPVDALDRVRTWCGHDHSPETDEQRAFVRAWRPAPPAAAASAPPPASS